MTDTSLVLLNSPLRFYLVAATAQVSTHGKEAAPAFSMVSDAVKSRLAVVTATDAAVVEIGAAAAVVVALCSVRHLDVSMVRRQPRDSAAQISRVHVDS